MGKKIEVKRFDAEVELRETEGKFKALICTYDIVDKGGDIVRAGAFDASLRRRRDRNERIPVVFNHQIRTLENYIGEINPHDTQSTSKGLIVSGELFISEPMAAKAHALLKRGTLREWSFGCVIEQTKPRPGGEGIEFLRLDLFEVSPTIVGKGTTQTLLVAAAEEELREGRTIATTPLTTAERLAPYRAKFEVLQQRVARRRGQCEV